MTFASYNVHGINTAKWSYMHDIFEKCDFLLLQETWLYDNQAHLFSDNLTNASFHCVSGMEQGELLDGRPYGGCCIAWHDRIACSVSPVLTQSRRSCVVKIVSGTCSVLLCTVYMPCDTTYDRENQSIFDETLNELSSLADIENVDSIIIGGDFNTDLSRRNSLHTSSLSLFATRTDLSFLNSLMCYDVDYTYESGINYTKSTIDHFLVSSALIEKVRCIQVEHSVENLSDHSVLFLAVAIPANQVAERIASHFKSKPLWHKAEAADIERYQQMLDLKLSSITEPHAALQCTDIWCTGHCEDLEMYHKALIDACISAGQQCIPHSNDRGSHHQLPGWNRFIRPLRETACFWHSIWKSCGSPTQGEVATIRRATRARYHRAVKKLKKNEELARFASMGERFLQDDRRDFWTEVKKMGGRSCATPSMVDGRHTEEDIAEAFSAKYRELYNSVGYDSSQMEVLKESINHNVRLHSDGECASHGISVRDVACTVASLKTRKHDGNLGQYSDHLIHGSHRFFCCLSLLLNSLLVHNVVPENMLLSTVLPIPKNKRKSMNDSDNYRGIALSCVVGKLLDKIILKKCQDLQETSHQQFGFKKAHSTVQCTFVVNEVTHLYNSSGSDVYITLLDASRAFDRVDYIKLFRLLISRGICPIVTRFLLKLYTQQHVRVRWGNVCSTSFPVSNGVKQGGVLSPLLFTLYLDSLLKRLSSLPCGCRVGTTFCGALGYADDVVLLSPSLFSLRKQLDVCAQYAEEYNVLFNASKSKLIISRCDARVDAAPPAVDFMGGQIEVVDSERHLGNVIGNIPAQGIIQNACSDFLARVNMILRHFRWLRPDALYLLFKAYCMPLYGSILWDLSHTSIERFYVSWRKALRRLFRLPLRTHGYLLPGICGDQSIDRQLIARLIRFLRSSGRNGNALLDVCVKLAVRGSGSAVGNSLSVASRVARFCRHDVVFSNHAVGFRDTPDEENDATVGLIRDLLDLKHDCLTNPNHEDHILSLVEVDIFLSTICC